jgi:hypothetical protein
MPVPSKYKTFARRRSREMNKKRSPTKTSCFISCTTSAVGVSNDFLMSHGSSNA